MKMSRTNVAGRVLLLLALVWVFGIMARDVQAGDTAPVAEPAPGESNQGMVLCPPRGATPLSSTCLPQGSKTLTQTWLRDGQAPDVDLFPGIPLSDAWFRLPEDDLSYAWVKAEKTVLYRDPEQPEESARKTLPSGFVFLSFHYTKAFHDKPWLYVGDNLWIPAKDVMRVYPSRFRGFLFVEPPTRPFGWVVYPKVIPHTGPGWDAPQAPVTLKRYQRIEVLEIAKKGKWEWYRIGPNLWIPQYTVGLVFPRTTPPEGIPTDRWIEINVFEQTLAVYEHNRLRYATLISSGTGEFYTRVGTFRIYRKLPLETMQGAFLPDRSDFYYLEDVPWTMYYDEARAIHGAYWHDGFGFPQSHGCVNLSVTDAYWVYQWAQVGDWVYVWDPTGRTPAK